MEFQYEFCGKSYPVHIKKEGDGFRVNVGEEVFEVTSKEIRPGFFTLNINGKTTKMSMASEGNLRHIFFDGHVYKFTRTGERKRKTGDLDMLSPDIASPISGKVVKVGAADGAEVGQGQVLMTIEAMKMEYQIKAPYAGTVECMNYKEGDQVDIGAVLVRMMKGTGDDPDPAGSQDNGNPSQKSNWRNESGTDGEQDRPRRR
jgi:3-methylcrotonyl-CoA carboxylase alpha subunit